MYIHIHFKIIRINNINNKGLYIQYSIHGVADNDSQICQYRVLKRFESLC